MRCFRCFAPTSAARSPPVAPAEAPLGSPIGGCHCSVSASPRSLSGLSMRKTVLVTDATEVGPRSVAMPRAWLPLTTTNAMSSGKLTSPTTACSWKDLARLPAGPMRDTSSVGGAMRQHPVRRSITREGSLSEVAITYACAELGAKTCSGIVFGRREILCTLSQSPTGFSCACLRHRGLASVFADEKAPHTHRVRRGETRTRHTDYCAAHQAGRPAPQSTVALLCAAKDPVLEWTPRTVTVV